MDISEIDTEFPGAHSHYALITGNNIILLFYKKNTVLQLNSNKKLWKEAINLPLAHQELIWILIKQIQKLNSNVTQKYVFKI